MDRETLEQDIQAAGRTAARITPTHVQESIASEHYFTGADGARAEYQAKGLPAMDLHMGSPLELLTICVLVLTNGYTVIGTSACASPENFNAEVGREIARKKAVEKLWPLLGFRLRDKIASGEVP